MKQRYPNFGVKISRYALGPTELEVMLCSHMALLNSRMVKHNVMVDPKFQIFTDLVPWPVNLSMRRNQTKWLLNLLRWTYFAICSYLITMPLLQASTKTYQPYPFTERTELAVFHPKTAVCLFALLLLISTTGKNFGYYSQPTIKNILKHGPESRKRKSTFVLLIDLSHKLHRKPINSGLLKKTIFLPEN